MQQTQRRQPKGRPTGGEYATHDRDEATVALMERPQDDTPAGMTFTIPAHRVELAEDRIAKANKRLERAGVTERFSIDVDYAMEERDDQLVQVAHITLNRPVISHDGWTFTGAHEFTPDGSVITHADAGAPDVTDAHCDFCNTTRRREAVYTLRHDNGQEQQVGSTCLQPFLGVKPAGLWALTAEIDLDGADDDDEELRWDHAAGYAAYDVEDSLVAALIASHDGTDFVSRNGATHGRVATSDQVMGDYDTLMDSEHVTPARRAHARAVIDWLRTADIDNDYMKNLHAAVIGDGNGARWVKRKHLPLAVSAIAAHQNALDRAERQAQRAALAAEKDSWQKDYLAAPGEKIAGIRGKILAAKVREGGFQTYGPPKMVTHVKVLTDTGHIIQWTASGIKTFERGTDVHVKGTVKANEEFNGEWQTRVTRATITDASTGEKLGDNTSPAVLHEDDAIPPRY